MDIDIIERQKQKLVRVDLHNETVQAEAGALHYYRGNFEVESQSSDQGFLSSMMSGESFFKPTYTGTGEVYFVSAFVGEFKVLHLREEEWIVDRGAYVCSEPSVSVSAFRNEGLSGVLGGEGMFQTKLEGTGRAVIQSPGKLQSIELEGETLAVDGDFAVARTGNVDYTVERASKSRVGSVTSGEGRLNVFKGYGTVLLAPVPNRHYQQHLGGGAQSTNTGGSPLGNIITLALVVLFFIVPFCGCFLVPMLGGGG